MLISPLIHDRKVGGVLRLDSQEPNSFTTDDLRILDAIATLASSAVSNAILYHRTEELAIRDSLTGLYVQRYFRERLAEEHRRSYLLEAPLTLLMCDLDHFKDLNDRYGHGVGDMVLIQSAQILSKYAESGIVVRYGGEEFALLIPKIDLKEGQRLAEKIRTAFEAIRLTVRRELLEVTISIGVASIPEDTRDQEELIHIADTRLYEAKRKGRNRVC